MKILAGVIGTGIGEKHIEAINSHKFSKVKIICEKNKKKFHYLKKKFPNTVIVSNEKSLFSYKGLNLISIASHDEDHFKQIILSIKHKIFNIIVEKPLCMDERELKILTKLVNKNAKIKIISNLVLRTNLLFTKIKKIISPNNIIYAEFDYIWGRLNKLYGWRAKTKKYSLILGAAIHMIDLALFFIGRKPKSVTAFGNNIGVNKKKFNKESFITLNLEFANKMIVKITANATGVHPHFHDIRIYEKNKTFIHDLNQTLIIKKKNNKFIKENHNYGYPDKINRKKLIQGFLEQIIVKNKKPFITFADQKNLMTICFSAIKSLKLGKKIIIKY